MLVDSFNFILFVPSLKTNLPSRQNFIVILGNQYSPIDLQRNSSLDLLGNGLAELTSV